MVKVTFKNVGQGDSIIIEWNDLGIQKIGIVDANLFAGRNPVLDHLKEKEYTEIDFIILSHPHADHFSGLHEIFSWALNQSIKINSFHLTSQHSKLFLNAFNDYINKSLISNKSRKDLERIFMLVNKLVKKDNNPMKVYFIDDNPDTTKKISDWRLKYLSPSMTEYRNFFRGKEVQSPEQTTLNHPNGNWLSTVILLYKDDYSILLTSDAEKNVFTRLRREKYFAINKQIILAQAPHHGSKRNHNKVFWEQSKRKINAPLAISVGKNNHRHPSQTVIDCFTGLQFRVERTDSQNINTEYDKYEFILDSISKAESKYFQETGTDLIFELDKL